MTTMIVKLINNTWNLIKLCVIVVIEFDLIDVKFIYKQFQTFCI